MSQIVPPTPFTLLNFANSVMVGRGRPHPGLYPVLEPLTDGADDPPFHSLLLSPSDDSYTNYSILLGNGIFLDTWYESHPVTRLRTNGESFTSAGHLSHLRDDTLVTHMSRRHLELPEITESDEEDIVSERRVPIDMKHSVRMPPPISIAGAASSHDGPMTSMALSPGARGGWMSPLPSPLLMNSPTIN